MKYIYSYKEYKINEEFLGLINFFKGFFKKMAGELQKLNNDPNKIKNYLVTNTIPALFKKEVDNFRQIVSKNESRVYEAGLDNNPVNTTSNQQNANDATNNKNQTSTSNQTPANNQTTQQDNQQQDTKPASSNTFDQKAFGLIDSILNTDTGVFGKQGIGLLFNDKSLQGENMKTKRISIEYIINTVRDQMIKSLGYNQKKNINRSKDGKKFVDMTYLPKFKEMLISVKNDPNAATQNVENVIKWVETNVRDVMVTNINAIKEDDIRAAVQKGGGTTNTDNYAVNDVVKYKMDGYQDGVQPDQQKDMVGEKPILRIEGDTYIFKDTNGREFKKTKEQLLGKAQGNGNEPAADELAKKLTPIKQDKNKMNIISKVVDLVNTPEGINKINSVLPKAA